MDHGRSDVDPMVAHVRGRIPGPQPTRNSFGLLALVFCTGEDPTQPSECLQFPDPNLRLDDGVPVLRRDFGLAATSWHCAHNSRCGLGHASWNKVFRGRYLINRAGPAAPQIIFSGNAPVFKTQVLSLWVGLNQN